MKSFEIEQRIRREALEEGLEEGRKEGSKRYSRLIGVLFEQHREQELKLAAEDEEYRNRLYEEFHIL